MRSVLGSVGSRRRSTTSTALLNASAFGLRGYGDTISLLVAMLLLDRSCMIVGKFRNTTFPNSGIRARSMRSFYARVEHKVVVGVDVANSSCRY